MPKPMSRVLCGRSCLTGRCSSAASSIPRSSPLGVEFFATVLLKAITFHL